MSNAIAEFRVSQLDPRDKLWDLILLTGTGDSMWAGTCGEYILQTWPDTVQELQEVFDMISGNGMPIVSRRVRGARSDSGVTIEMHLSGGQDCLAILKVGK